MSSHVWLPGSKFLHGRNCFCCHPSAKAGIRQVQVKAWKILLWDNDFVLCKDL